MATSEAQADLSTESPALAAPGTSTRRWRWYHAVMVLSIAGIAVMWLYAFSPFPRRTSPMYIADAGWRSRAAARCHATQAAIEALPLARTATSPQARAATLDVANNLLADMVAALRSDRPDSASDQAKLGPWLTDYEAYVENRRDHADLLRSGRDTPFAQAADQSGAPISLRMDSFARVNRMDACEVPRDV